ncbi:MAG: anti-sigma factor family protein, partial [bacterium]
MTCSKARKFIPFLVHAELNKSNREALNRHLRNCTRCQAIADDHGTLAKLTSSMPGPIEPPEFYETFFQEIQQRISQDFLPANTKSNLATHSKWSLLNPRLALVGIVILFTIVIGLYFLTHNYFPQIKHRPTLE